MATADTSRTPAIPLGARLEPRDRLELHDVSWEDYTVLSRILNGRTLRITYDRGHVEIMSSSPAHEKYKYAMARLVDLLIEAHGLDFEPLGSTTLRREDLERGFEADERYYIGRAHQVRDKPQIDLRSDPAPDLAIEVDISSSSLPRLPIYAAVGVTEVWRFDGVRVVIYRILDSEQWLEVAMSQIFPRVSANDLTHLVQGFQGEKSAWIRTARDWARDQFRSQQ